MSLLTIAIGAVAGGFAGLTVRLVNLYCVRWLLAQTTLSKLLQGYRALLWESDWGAFQQAYLRLLRTSLLYALLRVLTALIVVAPVLLLYWCTAALCQAVDSGLPTASWLRWSDWSFWLAASLGTLLAAWLPDGKS